MTHNDNLKTARLVIDEAFTKGNYKVLHDCFPPTFVEHQFGLHPTIEGLQGDIDFLRRAFPDFRLIIESMVADGDKVWVLGKASGTNLGGFLGSPNGKSFEIWVFDLLRFENGLIVEHWGSPDRFALLAQLGMLPQKEQVGR